MSSVQVGILGYGNLGRGAELALQAAPDLALRAIFTRRPPGDIQPLVKDTPVFSESALLSFEGKLDVLLLCGGSATDLPRQGPAFAGRFNTADTFDTHPALPAYYEKMNETCLKNGTVSILSMGWDPGLFSIARTLFGAALPGGAVHTFWGRGVSQGHSDAIRRIPGVADARQYTVPVPSALKAVENGSAHIFTKGEMHRRECYVVLEEGADPSAVKTAICTMPAYFEGYDTTVTFISEEEMKQNHASMAHEGAVFCNGTTAPDMLQKMSLRLQLTSNPQFTGAILAAGARAAARLAAKGQWGAYTPPEVAPIFFSPLTPEQARKNLV